MKKDAWTNHVAVAAVDALLAGLTHARNHGDTSFVTRTISLIPRERRWRYAQWIHAFSPIVLRAKGSEIFAKHAKPDDLGFRDYAIDEAIAGIDSFGLGVRGLEIPPAGGKAADKLKSFQKVLDKASHTPDHPDIKARAIKALKHAEIHHDVSLMHAVIRDLPHGYWERGFADWLFRFSPIRLNHETGRIIQIKRDSSDYRDYDIEGAEKSDIIRARVPVDVRSLLNDHPIHWKLDMGRSSHRELLERYQDCVSAIIREGIFDSPGIGKLLSAFGSEWLTRHEANDFFSWPTSDARPGRDHISGVDAAPVGIFSALGYHVGKLRGQPDLARQFLLDQIFSLHLPPINGPDYMRPWGPPASAARLRKMAYFIAQEIKNGKRRNSQDMETAIFQWTVDLQYLYTKYYVGRFGFAFPSA